MDGSAKDFIKVLKRSEIKILNEKEDILKLTMS